MSQNTKVAVAVVVVIVLAGAAYYWYQNPMSQQDSGDFSNASTTLPSGDSTTDESLQQDTAAIDAQLNGLTSDQATVDSSVDESGRVY